MTKTKIEWADRVWNPVTGCTKVSQGCKNCYAERMARRLAGRVGYPAAPNQFRVTWQRDRYKLPETWKKPSRIFVDSMSDLFHPDVLDVWLTEIWLTMKRCPQHTFMILTKRAARMALWMQQNRTWALPNVWMGVSVEDQESADERIPWLLMTPAAVRFVSYEPMLELIDLEMAGAINIGEPYSGTTWRKIDWVIAGCESGPKRRPAQLSWFRSVRDQCQYASVPFFLKQMSVQGKIEKEPYLDGRQWLEVPSYGHDKI